MEKDQAGACRRGRRCVAMGCSSADNSKYMGPSAYQSNPHPPAKPPQQAEESGPIDPLVAEEQRTFSPDKPVVKKAAQ